jgi:hypothetical protein
MTPMANEPAGSWRPGGDRDAEESRHRSRHATKEKGQLGSWPFSLML